MFRDLSKYDAVPHINVPPVKTPLFMFLEHSILELVKQEPDKYDEEYLLNNDFWTDTACGKTQGEVWTGHLIPEFENVFMTVVHDMIKDYGDEWSGYKAHIKGWDGRHYHLFRYHHTTGMTVDYDWLEYEAEFWERNTKLYPELTLQLREAINKFAPPPEAPTVVKLDTLEAL